MDLSIANLLDVNIPDWYESALCAQVGGDDWYPEKGESTSAAKAICRSCPVQVECLDYALANRENYGVWGGMSEHSRRKIAKGAESPPTIPCGLPGCDRLFPSEGSARRHRWRCPSATTTTQETAS